MITQNSVVLWSLMPRGVSQRLIDDAAWQALTSSDAFSNLDFDTMLGLSKVYKLQGLGVESTLGTILETLTSRESISPANLDGTLILLRNGFRELASQEEFLIGQYELILENLDLNDSP